MIIVYTLNCLGLTNLRINFRNCNRRFDFSADSLLQLCSWHCLFYTSNNIKYLHIHRKYLYLENIWKVIFAISLAYIQRTPSAFYCRHLFRQTYCKSFEWMRDSRTTYIWHVQITYYITCFRTILHIRCWKFVVG